MRKNQSSRITLPVVVAIAITGLVAAKFSDWFVIPKKRAPILAELKDPASAQFRNEHLQNGVLCGEVNAKNSMGGYVGFKRFISAGDDGNYLEEREPLNGWSDADLSRRKDLEAKIYVRFVDSRKDFPDLEAPTGPALESLAVKEFFGARWKDLCIQGDTTKA